MRGACPAAVEPMPSLQHCTVHTLIGHGFLLICCLCDHHQNHQIIKPRATMKSALSKTTYTIVQYAIHMLMLCLCCVRVEPVISHKQAYVECVQPCPIRVCTVQCCRLGMGSTAAGHAPLTRYAPSDMP